MSDYALQHHYDPKNAVIVRRARHGEPDAEFRLVILRDGVEVVSEPLTDVHVGVLASMASAHYFDRTKRVIWPAGGSMLHLYEKEQTLAEDKHLEWLRTSPAEDNRACAPDYEQRVQRRRSAPPFEPKIVVEAPPCEPLAPTGRRRIM